MKTKRIASVIAGLALAGGISPEVRADAVLHWNEVAGNAALAACISPDGNPLHESRLYAMVQLAIHDAVNAIDRRSAPYAYGGPAAPGASAEAAVAAAARGVLVAELPRLPLVPQDPCIDGGLGVANAAYSAALAAIPDGAAENAGVAVGQAAAAAIVALRATDGSDAPLIDFSYPDGTAPGEYRRTSEIPIVFATEWENVTPFALKRADQFRPRGPYPVSCVAPATYESAGSCELYARDFAEVKAYGGRGANARSADETDIALF